MQDPSLKDADRAGLLALLGTLPIVAVAPYLGEAWGCATAALWYVVGVAAMVVLAARAALWPARCAPDALYRASVGSIFYRLLGAVVLAFVGVVITAIVVPARTGAIVQARWTARDALLSSRIRGVLNACALYAMSDPGHRYPPSLSKLENWLRSSGTGSELDPSQGGKAAEQEVEFLRRGRRVAYFGHLVPVSHRAFLILVHEIHGPDGTRVFLVGKSDGTVRTLSADSFKKALQRDERLRVDRHLPPPAPELKWLEMEWSAQSHGR